MDKIDPAAVAWRSDQSDGRRILGADVEPAVLEWHADNG